MWKKACVGCGCAGLGRVGAGGHGYASATAEGWDQSEVPLDSAPQGWWLEPQHHSLSHRQPDGTPAASEWLQVLAPGGFVFTPFPRLWVLGGDGLEEVPICSWRRGIWGRRWVLCTFSFTHLPTPASSCLCSSCPWSHFLSLPLLPSGISKTLDCTPWWPFLVQAF